MSDTARLLVIVNNAAARARRAWPLVRAALEREGVRFDAHTTRHAGDARERTREALRAGYATIAAVGGDGTLSEVASGFFESRDALAGDQLPEKIAASSSLAVLPAGTGDDFARGLSGGVREPLDVWVGRLVKHCRAQAEDTAREAGETVRAIDVLLGSASGGAGRFVCLNAATLGIGAEVAARVASQRGLVMSLPGEARFALAAVRALAAWRERRMRVRVDGGAWRECLTNIAAVTNGTYAGGGMNFSPAARLDDGLLDVVTAGNLTRAEIVRELTRIHRGGHVNNPKVIIERGRRVRLETLDESDALGIEADGDVRGRTPVELRVIPSALSVVF